MADTMTRMEEIYNEAYSEKSVEHIKYGDVQFYINSAIYQAEVSLEHWEDCVVKYKLSKNDTLENWAQGKVEGTITEITNLRGLLKNLKRCK